MAPVQNDLDQRLRSMILGNAQNEDRTIEAKTNRSNSHVPPKRQHSSYQQHFTPRVNDHEARGTANRGSTNVLTSTRAMRASNARRGVSQAVHRPESYQQQSHWGESVTQRHGPPPTGSQHPHRGQEPTAARPGGPLRGGRRGTRPSSFRPLSRPRQPTEGETQLQSFHLEELAKEELPRVEMTLEEHSIKESFRGRLQNLLRAAASEYYQQDAPAISLVTFGSLASGFGMPGSDMDLALISDYVPDDLPRMLESTILGNGLGARLLTRTRVPILKVCEQPTRELYEALCDERKKWDEMTPTEKEEHDRGPPKKKETDKQGETATQDSQLDSHDSRRYLTQGGELHQSAGPVQIGAISPQQETEEKQLSTVFEPAMTVPKSSAGQQKFIADATSPELASAQNATLSPEHLQYLQTIQIIRKDKPHELENWISLHPPPMGLDVNTALRLSNKQPLRRKERPWYREKPPGPLDFPKQAVGILCDINFSNPLGIHNTALLHAYAACDVRVRLLVLFVKLWAGRRKINSGYNGTLSSYGYVLMVLHFLVNVAQPPVCPNLQLWETMRAEQSKSWPPARIFVPADPKDPNQVCEGADVRFHRNETELADLAHRQLLTHNRDPLGLLLRNFFVYYATQGPYSPSAGFNWTQDVLSLRSPGGRLSKVEKNWTGAKTTEEEGGKEIRHRYLFAIEDPFELDHNVARTVTHHGIVAIRDEFRRCARILDKVGRGERHDEGSLLETLIVESPAKDGKEEQAREAANETDGK